MGDQMEFWTNGLFKSTMHRAVFLRKYNRLEYYSIPYFAQANPNASLAPVDHNVANPDGRVYTAGQQLQKRLAASHEFVKRKMNFRLTG